MKINIVVLAKDRQKLTRQTTDTLYRNTDVSMFNVTIVDDCGERDTLHQTIHGDHAHADNLTCVRIQRSHGVTAMARNVGVYWSEQYWGRGDFLYLSDNDVYFKPYWLERMLAAFAFTEPHGLELLAGWNHPYHLNNETAKIPGGSLVCTNGAIAGASQMMRWSVWDKHGPLKHGAPGVCQGEDVDFCKKITDAGGKVAKVYPHVIVNAGVTNSHGVSAPGADLMLKELEAERVNYPDLVWE
jgi:hypothetical protein